MNSFDKLREEANLRAGGGPLATRDASRANRGKGLEDALEAMHDIYAAQGRAVVKKQFPKVIKRGRGAGAKAGQALHAASPLAVDFMGALEGGRAVAVEAKECSDGRMKIGRVTDGQRDFMREWMGAGFLVVSLLVPEGRGHKRRVYAVTFARYLAAWDARVPAPGRRRPPGRGSFGPAWFQANRTCHCPPGGLDGVDWLSAVAA
jgi:penicillin-binding protein-related factor A (putative recombinase)